MKYLQWGIALIGVAGLAALTITTEMPWVTKTEVAMDEAVPSDAAAADESNLLATTLTCPADAKPANLDFTLKDANGQDVALSQYKGKVVLLDFWATWCGPCKVEIPHFIEFQNQYGEKGLQILGVSIDDTADQLQPYIRDMKINYPILQGLGQQALQDAFGPILGIPVAVMISRDAKICATHTGLTSKDVFEREITALLGAS